MDWTLYPEEWSLLAAAAIMIVVLGLTLAFGVRYRLAWLQLPAATRDGELTTFIAAREAELLDLERQKEAREGEIRGLEARVLERDRLEAEAEHWKSQVEAAKAEHAGLGAMRSEVEQVREDYRQALEKLAETQTQLGEARGNLEDARGRAEAVERQREGTEREIEDRGQALDTLRREIDETKALATKEQAELAEVRRALEEVRERQSSLVRETEALEGRRRELLETLQQEEGQLKAVKEELASLADKRKALQEVEDRVRELGPNVDRLQSEEARLNARIARQEAELEGAGEGEDRALEDLLSPPACLIVSDGGTDRPSADESEIMALNRVRKHLQDSGFDFHDRQVMAFHTSLKTAAISPLTVLAGISGTGKSQLPRIYAEAMGMHFLKLPVQPRWDGPQDLFGFYNYIERRYRATELSRALVHLDPYNWREQASQFEDRMLLVLLDEMNLARVEYYFSEFLSRLEGRALDDGATDNDAIRAPSEIEIDVSRQGQTRRVYVGQNVLFVGTMNEDESTQSLSDKVLDRANLMRFPKPEELKPELPEPKPGEWPGYLPKSRWRNWMRKASDQENFQRARGYVQRINAIMDDMGRPFGHRTGQAMLHYAANYPDRQSPNALATAISDQIELRILPRLRGVSREDHHQPLWKLHAFVDRELADRELAEALRASLDSSSDGSDLFIWRGLTRR